jgi:hypothetical protein
MPPGPGPSPAVADDQGRRTAQKRGAEDAAPEAEHVRRTAPRLTEPQLGRPPTVPSSPSHAAFSAEHQAAGPSYLVSARKASKRPAADPEDEDGSLGLPLSFTPAPPRIGQALNPSEARPAKRLASASAAPRTGPWWLKAGGSARELSSPPRLHAVPAAPMAGASRPLASPTAPASASKGVLAAASATAHGGGATSAAREDAQVQWQRAVRLSVGAIRPVALAAPARGRYGVTSGAGGGRCASRRWPSLIECPLNARLVTGVGLSFFLAAGAHRVAAAMRAEPCRLRPSHAQSQTASVLPSSA